MFGKCCHLRSTTGSNSSLDSSSSGTSEIKETKEQGLRFQGSRCSSDGVMLGEMMFGSVAMSYKGSTLKIHQIRSEEGMVGHSSKHRRAQTHWWSFPLLSSKQVTPSADAEQSLHSQDGRKCVRQSQHVSTLTCSLAHTTSHTYFLTYSPHKACYHCYGTVFH